MNMQLIQSMATEQGLLSFQLLQYHILMPSLLISKRSSECQGCPSRLENMREAKLANHLAINQLNHIIIGHLATHSTKFPKTDGPNELCSNNSCFPAVTPKKNSTTTVDPFTPATTTVDPFTPAKPFTTGPVTPAKPFTTGPVTPAKPFTTGPVTPAKPFTTGPVTPATPFTTGPVTPGQFPFLVSIQVTNFHKTYLHLCGGIIISPTWILTAAHCLETERPSELVVVSGETDIGTPIDPGKMTLVTEYFKHPNYTYDVKPYAHDVALIHLATPVTESEFVQIAPLPDTSFRDSGVECQEAGWGPTRDNEPGSNIMKVLTIPILPKDHCNAAYSTMLGDTSICAGLDGIGSCVGDNGGPLVCNSKPVAIMSWRDGCARPGKPAVYMDIAKYLPWIGEITGLDFQEL